MLPHALKPLPGCNGSIAARAFQIIQAAETEASASHMMLGGVHGVPDVM